MTTWKAEPHTLAKIAILRNYLEVWYSIVGSRFVGKDIHYLDGFAGPGQYLDGEDGSPLVALSSANRAISKLTRDGRWVAGRIKCSFVESDDNTFKSLTDKLKQSQLHPRTVFGTYHGELDRVLSRIQSEHPAAFGNAPLFAFLDPFGLKGLSWATVESILATPTSEVLLLFDADGVTRTTGALGKGYNAASARTLSAAFGGEEWVSGIAHKSDGRLDFEASTRNFVSLYKARLSTIVPWVYSFQMITPRRKANSEVGYHLIFASSHKTGLVKMKEVMKSQGQAGEFAFANARSGPQQMLNLTDPRSAAKAIHSHFRGRSNVPLGEIEAFVLNETDYIGPSQPLKSLEQHNLISVHASSPSRRRNTYPADKVASISFTEEVIQW